MVVHFCASACMCPQGVFTINSQPFLSKPDWQTRGFEHWFVVSCITCVRAGRSSRSGVAFRDMAKMEDLKGLPKRLLREHKKAKVICDGDILGKDVVVFVGCCGSGKSTVSAYVTEMTTFQFSGGKLVADKSVRDFIIGSGTGDVTRGLATEEIPNTSLYLVDSAGTGASYNRETGVEQEIFGAISRQAVLHAARSVRLVLFLSAERCCVRNDRGKHAILDFNHLAAMFQDDGSSYESVAFIITSSPQVLNKSTDTLVVDALEEMAGNLLRLTGKQCDEGFELVTAEPTTAATDGGQRLMEYCHTCLESALHEVLNVEADSDMGRLNALIDSGCTIFPVNVLEQEQQHCLQRWLKRLRPITDPAVTLKCRLPVVCENELQRALQFRVIQILDKVNSEGSAWAKQDAESGVQLLEELPSLIEILTTLEEYVLLPGLGENLQKLATVVCKQNQDCVKDLQEGVRRGCSAALQRGFCELEEMDRFAEICPTLKGQDWTSSSDAKTVCLTLVRERFDYLLPGGFGNTTSWNERLADDIRNLLEVTALLGASGGSKLLAEWAEQLSSLVRTLEDSISTHQGAQVAISALSRLSELQEFLGGVVATFREKGIHSLPDLNAKFDDTKKKLRAQVAELSESAVGARQLDMNADGWRTLRQFCGSTELEHLLGEQNLEETFIVTPLTSTLTQKQLDEVVERMATGLDDDEWEADLRDHMHTLQGWGHVGSQRILEAARLNLDGIVSKLQEKVKAQHEPLLEVVSFLKDVAIPHSCTEELKKLEKLFEFDWLIQHFGKKSDTVRRTLDLASSKLRQRLERLLEAAEGEKEKTFNEFDMVREEKCFRLLVGLQHASGLANKVVKILHSNEALRTELPDRTKGLVEWAEKAQKFVTDAVMVEVNQWWRTKIGSRGWCKEFLDHVASSDKLQQLRPVAPEISQARKRIGEDIRSWHRDCLEKAKEAAENNNWQHFVDFAVRQALAFEVHDLARKLGVRESCWPLVEKKAQRGTLTSALLCAAHISTRRQVISFEFCAGRGLEIRGRL